MSAKTTGIIWDLVLPAPQRMVLLAMVDHADHDGGHIYAPIPFIAWKTGYSARNTARIIQDLIDAGLLSITKQGLGESNEYQFDLSHGVVKPKYKGRRPKTQPTTHDKMSGVKERTHAKMAGDTHDKMSGVDGESPPTHDKMASPHDKMAWDTHDKMAIDSISTIVGGVGVGVGEPLFLRELIEREVNPTTAQTIVQTHPDNLPTILQSLDNMLADGVVTKRDRNATIGQFVTRLKMTPPEPGRPYPRTREPIISAPLVATQPHLADPIEASAAIQKVLAERTRPDAVPRTPDEPGSRARSPWRTPK